MKTLVLSISYGKGCYRHLKISDGATLAELHECILDAFDFIDDHMHVFFMGNRAWADNDAYYSNDEDGEGYEITTEHKLSEFKLEKNSKFIYIFDFDEEHRFQIKVLRVEDEITTEPKVIRSVGEAPQQYPCLDVDANEEIVKENISSEEKSDREENNSDESLKNIKEDSLKTINNLTPEERKRAELLDQYATAAINLYGVISQHEFVDIFNSQNQQKTTIEEVFNLLINYVFTGASYVFYEMYIVHATFTENDYSGVRVLLNECSEKPRYIPLKNKLLKYADEMYNDEPVYMERIKRFIEKKCSDNELVKKICSDIYSAVLNEVDETYFTVLFNRNGISFNNSLEYDYLMNLLADVKVHSRLWSNNGYTLLELRRYYKAQLVPNKKVKVGRNDPCPCGSGKKYKKCCGR